MKSALILFRLGVAMAATTFFSLALFHQLGLALTGGLRTSCDGRMEPMSAAMLVLVTIAALWCTVAEMLRAARDLAEAQ